MVYLTHVRYLFWICVFNAGLKTWEIIIINNLKTSVWMTW